MSDETLVARYRKKLENNKLFAFLVIITLLLSSSVAAIAGIKSLLAYFSPAPPPTFEEQVASLARKGCILFLPDSLVAQSKNTFILNAYKDFWRRSDIYYATRIEIDGITHHRGTAEYNLAIGQEKARAAEIFIIEHARIVPEQTEILTQSYGEERPLERAGEYECGALVRVFHN